MEALIIVIRQWKSFRKTAAGSRNLLMSVTLLQMESQSFQDFRLPILELLYTIFAQGGIITRSARFTNEGTSLVHLLNAMSLSLDLPDKDYVWMQFSGAWSRERHVKERRLDGISGKISDYKKLAEELGVGEITLQDIVKELEKPARDPREDMPKPILRSDVLDMKDLKPGMILKGTVRNVIDFGAFVDIGVHQDGLVHISQMCDRFIKHPLEVVSVGDIVEVKVLDVDLKKQRIALTMKING